MKDERKTNAELINELMKLRRRVKDLEASEIHLKQLEEDLWESEERFRILYENAPIPYQSLNEDGYIIEANQAWLDTLGYSAEEVMGRWFGDFLPADYQEVFRERFPMFKKLGVILGAEFEMVCTDGSEKIVSFNGKIGRDQNGEFRQTHCVFTDITERKRAEDQIRKQLAEMEVLLKEIHHRVKNNLQIISSLLNLQARYIQDKRAQESFKESINRIKTMALIHETLYQSKDLAKIDFSAYIQKLTSNLIHSHRIEPHAIHTKTNIENVIGDINMAIPCGLIINELVSNSLKHAFPE